MPSNDRIEALLGEMTLEEKIAQLGSVWPGASHGTDDEDAVVENVAPMQDIFAQPGYRSSPSSRGQRLSWFRRQEMR
jgi:hypothetical protein